MKKWFWWFLAVLILVSLSWAGVHYLIGGKESGYQTIFATVDDVVQSVSITGTVVADQEVNLYFSYPGRLKEIKIEVGDEVEKDEVLAVLDTAQLKWQTEAARSQAAAASANYRLLLEGERTEDRAIRESAIAAARAQVDSAKNSLTNITSSVQAEENSLNLALSSAQIQLNQAESNLSFLRSLYYSKGANDPTRDSLYLQILSQESQVVSLRQAVRQAEDALSFARIRHQGQIQAAQQAVNMALTQLGQTIAQTSATLSAPKQSALAAAASQASAAWATYRALQAQLDEGTLKAPLAGKVIKVNFAVGESTSGALPVVTLATTESLLVEAEVPETDIRYLNLNQKVRLTFDALEENQVFEGQLVDIAPSADIAPTGVTVYGIKIALTGGNLSLLKPGMTADMDIITGLQEDVLTVPKSALRQRKEGGYYVEVLRDGKSVEVSVGVGLIGEVNAEILEGIEAGEAVILGKGKK